MSKPTAIPATPDQRATFEAAAGRSRNAVGPNDAANAMPERHLATDEANAQRIAIHFGDTLAFTSVGWLRWDGRCWTLDEAGALGKAASIGTIVLHEAAEALERAAAEHNHAKRKRDTEAAEELAKWSRQSEMTPRVVAALSLARPKLHRRIEDFDANPFLFNVQNGVLDLRTGQFLPHDPGLHLTKVAGCAFDSAVVCPSWQRFLHDVFLGDAELIAFVQRLFGYFLTGSTRDHIMPIAYGIGANGKTTFMRTIEAVLGEYARPAPAGMFEAGSDGRDDQHVALLRGLRLVLGHETERGAKLRESFIKNATGGDKLSGRHLYSEHFDFTPTHKLVLSTNYRPRVSGTDRGIWRRLLLIPFEAKFTAEEGNRDPNMIDRLLSDLPGILNWALDGCVEWQRQGLNPPGKVRAATEQYRKAEDLVQQFVDQRCDLDPATATASGEVYRAYTGWAQEQGIRRPMSQRALTEELKRMAVIPGRSGGRSELQGIKIRP